MARPTTIKVPSGGEIIIKNCSKEVIEEVRNLILSERSEPEVVAAPIAPTAAPIPVETSDAPMHCTALGVYQNPLTLNWHMCTVKFSPYSKKAALDTDIPVDRDKSTCDERFKISAVTYGLVG